jgi:hypothetical protein
VLCLSPVVMYHGLARHCLAARPFLDAAAAEQRYVGRAMTVRGTISRDPRLTLKEWLDYVARRSDFVAPEPRIVANPFKSGAPVLWTPEPGDVSVLRNGAIVGGIAPSLEFDVDRGLDVFYPDEHQAYVRHAATEVAKDLRALIVWDDRQP